MNSIPIRADAQFKELLDNIRTERRRLGKDKRDLSDVRLTKAISRITNIDKIVINADIIDEKKKWKELDF